MEEEQTVIEKHWLMATTPFQPRWPATEIKLVPDYLGQLATLGEAPGTWMMYLDSHLCARKAGRRAKVQI